MAKLTPEEIQTQLLKATVKYGLKEQNTEHLNVSLEDIESFGDKESLRNMLIDINKYNKMLEQRITLVNESLSAAVPFTRENLYLFCAYTGSGKSTIAANISYPLWKQGKKSLVLSNEESQHDIMFRIACLDLGLSFNAYKKGEMPAEQQMQCVSLFPDISKYVKVIDVNYKGGLTTKIEGVMNALEAVRKEEGYSCVMIDYFQLIKFSAKDSSKTAYDNLNNLRVWLGQYIKNSTCPIVLFAQLYSISKRGGAKDIDARIKDCSAIVEPATVIIEAVPNFDTKTTDFIIHKDRFGRAGTRIECGFENGRYVKISMEDIAKRESEAKRAKAEEALAKISYMVGDSDADK
jgi:replicative DNA helicase